MLDSWYLLHSFHVVTERIVLLSTTSFLKAAKGLVASYYVFNIQYPPQLLYPLTFLQHFLFDVKEDKLPPITVCIIITIEFVVLTSLSIQLSSAIAHSLRLRVNITLSVLQFWGGYTTGQSGAPYQH